MTNHLQPPQLIFLDAVGTLFGVRGSVGEVYAGITREFGVEAPVKLLDKAFIQCFKAAPKMAFTGIAKTEIGDREKQWWKQLAVQTFTQVGIFAQFNDFDRFFDRLYDHFAQADPWYVYPDAITALKYWRNMGVDLAVVSNFDSRLYAVLEALDLVKYFSFVTISTEVGAAKPDREIFDRSIDKYAAECDGKTIGDRAAIWHIGDSFSEDYLGAKSAEIQAIWLDRYGIGHPQPKINNQKNNIGDRQHTAETIHTISSLEDLIAP